MSAKILLFAVRPRRERRPAVPSNEFRSPIQADDLVMDHADTAPCEYCPCHEEHNDDDPA